MKTLDGVTKFPLSWPATWPRAQTRGRPLFKPRSMQDCLAAIYRELKLLGVGDWNVVVSSNVELRRDGLPYSNQARPADPGVAVYFRLSDGTNDPAPTVLACDRWETPEWNLYAIAKHVEAMRAQERWGVGNLRQAFAGYLALPARGETFQTPWWFRLGFDHEVSLEQAQERYRAIAREHHPDIPGGNAERFREAATAIAEAKVAFAPAAAAVRGAS